MEGFIATPKWCLVCPNGWRLHAQRDVETGRWEGELGSASKDNKGNKDKTPQPSLKEYSLGRTLGQATDLPI